MIFTEYKSLNTEKPFNLMVQLAGSMRSIIELDSVSGEVRAGLLSIIQRTIVAHYKSGIFDSQMFGSMSEMNWFCMERLAFPKPNRLAADFEPITGVK